MITFSKLGQYGRWANQLFQIAALHSFAKRYSTEYVIPRWSYSDVFETKFPEVDTLPEINLKVNEPHYKYDQEYFDQFSEDFKNKTVDLLGYFQSEKYFSSPEEIRNLFRIKPELIEKARKKFAYLLNKPTIAIGIRRGDYVGALNGNYYQLPVLYYLLSIQKFDYRDCNIVFISDDLEWCKQMFGCIDNSHYPECDNDKEQFILGTLMTEGWITANSTFHWFSSYLGNAKKVIQPSYLFAGKLLEKEGNENFYIEKERFEIFNHEI